MIQNALCRGRIRVMSSTRRLRSTRPPPNGWKSTGRVSTRSRRFSQARNLSTRFSHSCDDEMIRILRPALEKLERLIRPGAHVSVSLKRRARSLQKRFLLWSDEKVKSDPLEACRLFELWRAFTERYDEP